ncbi:sulfurtransferase [Egicoccus sp. AB-alg6-2]|uniref:sulfurtransferase n=1 Tax=Egicoccus sp. AB-alg6-2 TaxID=3242692 RepID=UPI00359DCCE1
MSASVPAVVSADDLQQLRRDAEVVLADVRWALDGSQGRDDYLAGHLPGAVFVDLPGVLCGPGEATDGRNPLPAPDAFAEALGRLGIGDDTVVVAYDQGGGGSAGRLVWLLRIVGQPAALLSGGLAAWSGPLESGPVQRTPVRRRVVAWPSERFADADEVARLVRDPAAVVVDARAPERYRGEREPVDPRPGHIPGAVNVPATANLRPDKTLRDDTGLRQTWEASGALDADEVVAYCGSGVSAALDLLALERLGVHGRLYVGSWSGWSADPQRPAATGDEPG